MSLFALEELDGCRARRRPAGPKPMTVMVAPTTAPTCVLLAVGLQWISEWISQPKFFRHHERLSRTGATTAASILALCPCGGADSSRMCLRASLTSVDGYDSRWWWPSRKRLLKAQVTPPLLLREPPWFASAASDSLSGGPAAPERASLRLSGPRGTPVVPASKMEA